MEKSLLDQNNTVLSTFKPDHLYKPELWGFWTKASQIEQKPSQLKDR